MNKKQFFVKAAVCVVLAVTVSLGLVSCKKSDAESKPADVDYYTCTMHPSVKSQDPKGKCPICSMDLVPVKKKSAMSSAEVDKNPSLEKAPSEFMVPVQRQQQIGVTFGKVAIHPFRLAVRAGGTVGSDQAPEQGIIWAQFFQDDLPALKKELPVTITTSAYPGEKFPGKIETIDPTIDETLRTARVKIGVEANSKLRPGMFVDVELSADMGEGLAVPVDAVLPTGLHNIVFVDKGGGRLEPRFAELGREYADVYEVKSGLKENERVVTSANFLIDAEAKVQGALKEW